MNNITTQQNIPLGWARLCLGKIVIENNKSILQVRDADNSHQYPFFTSGERILSHCETLVTGQNIYMATGGVAGIKFFEGDASYSTDTYSFKGDKVSTRYIYYVLLNNLKIINKHYFSGSGLKHLQKNDLKKYPILLPPSNEQQKIAEILGAVDENITKTQEVIEATEKLKRGLMLELFTRGIGNTEFKILKLGDISKISTGTTPSTSKPDYYLGANPFIKTGEIVNEKITQTDVFISDQAIQDYRLKKYRSGTILVAMYGQGKTRGQTAFLEIEACITQNAAAIEPNENIDPVYLWYFLKSQYELLRGSGVQGHISHLNLSYMKSYEIPITSEKEQREIAEILSAVDEKILINKKLKEKLILLKKGLMQDLLSGRVRINSTI